MKRLVHCRTLRAGPLSCWLAVAAVTGLTACRAPALSAQLFPLEEGHYWTYQVTTEWENQTVERDTLVLRNLGRDTLTDGSAWRRRSESGMNYWLRQDDSGVYRVASRSDLQADPQPDTERRYVLKEPLSVGTQWQATTTAYMLHRRQAFPREIRHSHPLIPMLYAIDALQQSVDTPAGHFEGCVTVKGLASVRLYVDPVAGWKDMPLTTREWYCTGVGLVKLVRDEPAGSTFLGGGTMILELKEWK